MATATLEGIDDVRTDPLKDATPVQELSGDVILGNLAIDQWNDYKGRFLPLEHSFAAKMAGERPAQRNKVVAGAMANVQDSMAQSNNAVMAQAGAAGLAPGSGKVMGLTTGNAGDMGGAAATGAVGANDAVTAQRWAGITKAMRQGRGQASKSISGLTSSAYLAEQAKALESKTSNAIQSSNYRMYGNVAGLAAGAGMHYYGGIKQPQPMNPRMQTGGAMGLTY